MKCACYMEVLQKIDKKLQQLLIQNFYKITIVYGIFTFLNISIFKNMNEMF